MKKFLRFAKKKAGAAGDRRSLSSFGSAASVDLGSSSEYGSVQNIPDGESLGYHVDLNSKDKKFTKLHRACWLTDLEKVKKLAKKDDVNRVDSEDRAPLHLACARGNKDVIWYLLGCKANLSLRDMDGCTPLLKAVECHHTHIVQFLLDRHADPKSANDNGDTGLHLAAKDNLQDICTLLLQKGTSVDASNKDGCTPLHLAIEHGHPELAEAFLRHGASVNTQDNNLRTCLMLASQQGYAGLVSELLDYGANSALLDSHSRNAETYAAKAGHEECVELLQKSYKEHLTLYARSNHDSSMTATDKRPNSASPTLRENVNINHDDGNSINSDSPRLDSWNDASDDEVQLRKKEENNREVSVPKLNLTKFMSSLDMSDKDISEMEADDLSEPLRPPPKPPRSMMLSDMEKVEPPPISPRPTLSPKKVIPLMASTGLDYDSDGQWDSEEEMIISAVNPPPLDTVKKTKEKEEASILSNLSMPSISISDKGLRNEDDTDADISEKDLAKVARRNRPVPQPRQRSTASLLAGIASPTPSERSFHTNSTSAKDHKDNGLTVSREMSNITSSCEWDSSDLLNAGERPVTVISITENNEEQFLLDSKTEDLAAVMISSQGDGDAPSPHYAHLAGDLPICVDDCQKTKSEETTQLQTHSIHATQSAPKHITGETVSSNFLQVADPKPRLYQKKGDNNTRHRRTPSGNIIRDIHPSADTVISSVAVLTDSDTDSNWSSSEDLPLTERKIQSADVNNIAVDTPDTNDGLGIPQNDGGDANTPNCLQSIAKTGDIATIEVKKMDSKESVAEISSLSTGSMLCLAEERDVLDTEINVPETEVFSQVLHAEQVVESHKPVLTNTNNVTRQLSLESHTMFVDFQDEVSGSEWDNESVENVIMQLTKKASLTSSGSHAELQSPVHESVLHEAVHSKTAGTPEPVIIESVEEKKGVNFSVDGGNQLATNLADSDMESGGDPESKKATGGNSTDGTLGRDGTLLGADEIWERNASLDFGAPAESDSTSESISLGLPPLATSVDSARASLVRQNAVSKDKTPSVGPGHVAAKKSLFEGSPTSSVDGMPRPETTEVKRKLGISSKEPPDVRLQFRTSSVDFSSDEARTFGMAAVSQSLSVYNSSPAKESKFPTVSSRRVSEMTRQFESLHDDSIESLDEAKPAEKVKINRTFSVDTIALENILKSKLENEADVTTKPLGNKLDWQMPVDLPNKLPLVSDRRHSVHLPMMTAPPGKSFKDVLAERHNQSEQHSRQDVSTDVPKAVGARSDPGLKSSSQKHNEPTETFQANLAHGQSQSESDVESCAGVGSPINKSRRLSPRSPKIGFGNRSKVASKFSKLSLKRNPVAKASEKQNSKSKIKKPTDLNNKDKGKKLESTVNNNGKRRASTALSSSLERIAGLTKFTKRLSLSMDPKSRDAITAHILQRKISSDKVSNSSMSPEPQGIDTEEEDQEDFVQEVLQRLDIRRRSSAGMLDSIPEALRQKKTSHTSSLEALSESTSSSDSESDIDDVFLDKGLPKVSTVDENAADSLSDSDKQSDHDLTNASLQISKSDWKDPKSILQAQELVKRLRVKLEKLKGENYILKERVKSITSERNDLQSKLESLQANHYSLQEKVVDLEAQVTSAQDERYYAEERMKTFESRLKTVSGTLQKKDEQLLAQSCRRQQVEMMQQTLESEIDGLKESIQMLTDCNLQLKNELAAAKKDNLEAMHNSSPSNPEAPSWAALNLKNREMTVIHKQLDEATLLCKQVMTENQSLQLEVTKLKRDVVTYEQQLAEQQEASDVMQNQSEKALTTVRQDLETGEEALKQTTLKYMVQVNDLQSNNQQLRTQLDLEANRCSEMQNQILSLQSDLHVAKNDVVSLRERAEEIDRQLLSQKEFYENKVTSLRCSIDNIQQEKEDLNQQLHLANNKVTHLEELLETQQTVLQDVEIHTRQSAQTLEANNECQKQIIILQQELAWVKQKLDTPIIPEITLENGRINGYHTEAIKQTDDDVIALTRPTKHLIVADQGMQTDTRTLVSYRNQQVQTLLSGDSNPKTEFQNEKLVQASLSPNHNQQAALDKCRLRVEVLENELQQRDAQIGCLEERTLEFADHHSEVASLKRSKQFMEVKQQKLLKELESREQQEAAIEMQLHQTKTELIDMQTKMHTLKSALAAKQEVANKMDEEHEQLMAQLEEARNNSLLYRERERQTTAEHQRTEIHLQQTEQQVLELQAHFEETLEAKVALQNQFYKAEAELRKANACVQQEKNRSVDLEYRLQEKTKLCESLEEELQHARKDNACLIEQLKKDVCDQRRLWETEARSRAELAARIWDMEQTRGETHLPLETESKIHAQKAISQREEVEKLLEKERERSSVLQEQIALLRQDAARTAAPEVPAEITSRIKDLKKQTEDLRSRVKQEREQRRRAEVQLTKARQHQSNMQRLRKRNEYLEQCRAELRAELLALQQHMQTRCVDRHQFDLLRQQYEVAAGQELNYKLGQVQELLEEQSKAQEHLQQVRLNNEVQLRSDLQRTKNDLLEEVGELRESLHQSQSHAESLQSQCDRLQELYNAEVRLRSQMTQDWTKSQASSVAKPFTLTNNNKLKHWKESLPATRPSAVTPYASAVPSANSSTIPDNSMVHKIKAELEKSIQRHLYNE